MAEYLIFRLYGPLAAWGTMAVGEIRPGSEIGRASCREKV
jgi:hypothetical protein